MWIRAWLDAPSRDAYLELDSDTKWEWDNASIAAEVAAWAESIATGAGDSAHWERIDRITPEIGARILRDFDERVARTRQALVDRIARAG